MALSSFWLLCAKRMDCFLVQVLVIMSLVQNHDCHNLESHRENKYFKDLQSYSKLLFVLAERIQTLKYQILFCV